MTLLERLIAAGLTEEQAASAAAAANAHVAEGFVARNEYDAAVQARDQNAEHVRTLRVDYALRTALAAAGAQYPDLLMASIDRNTIAVAEDGSVTGVDEALTGARQTYAGLFAPQTPPAPSAPASGKAPPAPAPAPASGVPPAYRTYAPPQQPTQQQLDTMSDADYYAALAAKKEK